MKKTVLTFKEAKENGQKLSILTAFDYSTAKSQDNAGIDGILVGDSLGMVALGYPNTLPVSMEDMIHHTRAVSRGTVNALLVADMPFMSYQVSVSEAVANAGRLIKEGRAETVKLEGGVDIAAQIRAIVKASVPVMGHIGMTPQSVNSFGGFKVQGKEAAAAAGVVRDALAVEDAGAFAVVLECVPAALAAFITKRLSIPTIGIGGGAGCDGQVLVSHDLLGLFSDFTPKFVKRYAHLGPLMNAAFTEFIQEVKQGVFPAAEHSFGISEEVMNELEKIEF